MSRSTHQQFQKLNDRLYLFSLCVMIISFPFSIALNSIAIGMISLFFFLDFPHLKENLRAYLTNKTNLLFLGIFVSISLSLAWSPETDRGIGKVIGSIAYVSLPMALTKIRSLPERQVRFLKKFHIFVCLVSSLCCLYFAAKQSGWLSGSYKKEVAPEFWTIYLVDRFTYHELSGSLNHHLHAVYYAFFISVGMIMLIVEFGAGSLVKRIFRYLLLAYFAAFLVLLNSVNISFGFYGFLLVYFFIHLSFKKPVQHLFYYALAAVSFVVCYYMFLHKDGRNFPQHAYFFEDPVLNHRFLMLAATGTVLAVVAVAIKRFLPRKYLSLVLFSLLATALFLSTTAAFQEKMKKRTAYELKDTGINNIQARFGNWTGALMVIQEHPLKGVGAGNEENALVEKYKKINFLFGVDGHLNAHNQYLEFWVGSGIFTLLCFLAILLLEAVKAFKSGNVTLLAMLMIFSLFCISESALLLQEGKLFFLLFLSLLAVGFRQVPIKWKNISR